MRAVVACEGLYNLVERFAPDAQVRYLPAELHEFPVNVPLEETIVQRVQTAIEALDGPATDAIVVSYGMAGADRATLSSRHAELVIAEPADCVSTVLPAEGGSYGERIAAGTLYLTRGWIDCGVDSYKLYRAYRDDVDELLEDFETAAADHRDMRVRWHRGDRFERAVERRSVPSKGTLDDFFRSVVQYFERVVLVDTGDLHEFHHEYAERVRGFVERLRPGTATEEGVDLTVIEGDTGGFRDLLHADRS